MEILNKLQILPISTPPRLLHIRANLTPLKSRQILEIDHEHPPLYFDTDKRNGLDILIDSSTDINMELKKQEMNLKKKNLVKKTVPIRSRLHMKTHNEDTCVGRCPCQATPGRRENSLVYINYNGHQAALVCRVCTADLSALKHRLSPHLRKYKSRFVNVEHERNPFRPISLIYVSLPSHLANGNSGDIEQRLQYDANECKALSYRMVNNKAGEVCFKCLPTDVQRVSLRLKKCGYKPRHTEVGHSARDPLVNLSTSQWQNYTAFLKTLQADRDVLKVYDNVKAASHDRIGT